MLKIILQHILIKKNANPSHDPSEIILICWFVAQET